MDYKNHLKTGAAAGLLTMYSLFGNPIPDVAEIISYSAGIVIGSALPDIDHPNSYIAKKLSIVGSIVSRVFSHRGFTHSIFFIILLEAVRRGTVGFFSYANQGIFTYFMYGLITAASTHILMDMFIGNGVKLLYPLYGKKIHIAKMKSGSALEGIFIKLLFVLMVIFILHKEGNF